MNWLQRLFWKPIPVVGDVWESPFNDSLRKVVNVEMNDYGDTIVSTARWVESVPGYGIASSYSLSTWRRDMKEQRRFVRAEVRGEK